MSTTMTTPTATWDDLKREASKLNQMVEQTEQMQSSTVIQAMGVGQLLRDLRLQHDVEEFGTRVSEISGYSERHARRLMKLALHRDVVMTALADGTVTSIRSGYEAVKGLPEPDGTPTPPRKRAGRPQGSKNAPKGKASAQAVEPVQAAPAAQEENMDAGRLLGWSEAVQKAYRELFGEVDLPEGYGRNNLTQIPALRSRLFEAAGVEYRERITFAADSSEAIAIAEAVRSAWLADNPAVERGQVKQNTTKREALAKAKQREFDQLVNSELARLRAQARRELNDAMEEMRADWQKRIDEANALLMQRKAEELRARQIRESLHAVMSNEEWSTVVRLLHSDRFPEEYRERLDKAVAILRQRIEPVLNTTPTARPYRTYAEATGRRNTQ